MPGNYFSEIRWNSEISTTAFCESLDLRRVLLEKRHSFRRGKQRAPTVEPSSAEFVSALAAGINSRHTLQIGCGLSTVTLAAAARATHGHLWSVHHEEEKQQVVQKFLKEVGLIDYVDFITEDPSTFIPQREGLEFVLLSGLPERYIELFDLLKLKKGAVVVAANALDDATNEYIRHVRRQPGVDSSTLPLNRGIEVTKIVTWEDFNVGRKWYEGCEDPINDREYSQEQGTRRSPSYTAHLSSSSLFLSAKSDVSSQSSRSAAGGSVIELEQTNSEKTNSGRHNLVNYLGLDMSDVDTHYPGELGQHEIFNPDGVGDQFQSMQSLAEQWRLQLAALDHSSETSLESTRAGPPVHLCDDTASYSTASELSVGSLCNTPSVYPQHEGVVKVSNVEDYATRLHWHLPMDLGNNDTSLSSSDASMADKVAPEPLQHAEAVVSTEVTHIGNEEPAFQVYFQNDDGQTEVTVEGVDQDMLLFDLTLAFNETGVSVKRAKISTQDSYVLDIFYVVDGGTKGPLLEAHWETVRRRILDRLVERRKLLNYK